MNARTGLRRPTPPEISALLAALTLEALYPAMSAVRESAPTPGSFDAAVLVGTIGAVLGSWALGPSGVAAIGLFAGAVGVGLSDECTSTILLGLGKGLFTPALFAVAARPFRASDGVGVLALVVGMGLMLFTSPFLGRTVDHPRIGFAVTLLAFGMVVAVVDAAVQGLYPAAAAPEDLGSRPVVVGAVAAGVLAVGLVLTRIGEPLGVDGSSWSSAAEPVGGLFGTFGLLAVCVVLVSLGSRLSPALFGGLGLVGTGLAIAGVGLVDPHRPPILLLAGLGAGSAVAWPALRVWCLRGVPWRASTAVVAMSILGSMVGREVLGRWTNDGWVVPAGVALVAIGAVVAVTAAPVDRWLLAPTDRR